jgi:hypothetical protein
MAEIAEGYFEYWEEEKEVKPKKEEDEDEDEDEEEEKKPKKEKKEKSAPKKRVGIMVPWKGTTMTPYDALKSHKGFEDGTTWLRNHFIYTPPGEDSTDLVVAWNTPCVLLGSGAVLTRIHTGTPGCPLKREHKPKKDEDGNSVVSASTTKTDKKKRKRASDDDDGSVITTKAEKSKSSKKKVKVVEPSSSSSETASVA